MDRITFGPSNTPGYITGQRARPAVIVLQEWWGVTEQIREHAGHIAHKGGHRVIVPDLYKGTTATSKEEAEHNMKNLDFKAAIQQVAEAAQFLKAEGCPTIGVFGTCMGGALAIGAAAAVPEISCAVSCYGVNFDLFNAQKIKNKPVQAHFGKLDQMTGFSDPSAATKLEAILEQTGQADSEVFMYESVGHAFLNFMPEPYADMAAREAELGPGYPPFHGLTANIAWSRILNFYYRHLYETGIADMHRPRHEKLVAKASQPTVA